MFSEKYGSDPKDWTLGPMDLYKSYSNTSKVRCHACRQFGHTAYNCKASYKPEICIMCGMEGHNLDNCTNKICLSVSFILFLGTFKNKKLVMTFVYNII